jgi:hypothetical protein
MRGAVLRKNAGPLFYYDHFGGPEVLKVVEDDIPQPGPGEVRVRVKGFKTTVRLETRHSRA